MITDEVLLKLMMWKDHEYIIYKHDTLGETIEHIERLLAEIERLREALALADAALSGANMNMKVVEKKIRAALEGEKIYD